MDPVYRQLYSGMFICPECESEWEVQHARELRCQECGSDDLEKISEPDADTAPRGPGG
jgi:DNA-directed RNA polymerase subunit RPC12/RpoP